ncbi:hypothetical protein NITMOv2_3371 [Nitrospira moscoviensis]|uniref:Uncharacterized protein n=1 Tax=Nitrospira moscoviensis TaxID=42253 RepID=A0A0K2GFM6_NITMO|nr:hypothetical protein NITMOv2_3371 [Nitrospira moscoviensis]
MKILGAPSVGKFMQFPGWFFSVHRSVSGLGEVWDTEWFKRRGDTRHGFRLVPALPHMILRSYRFLDWIPSICHCSIYIIAWRCYGERSSALYCRRGIGVCRLADRGRVRKASAGHRI